MTMPNAFRAGALALGLVLAAGAATMAEAKTFRLAINADASTLDPHAQNSQVNFAILLQAYEPLVGRDKDLKPVPVLATRWEAVEPMRWRFFLRPGVRFHDGATLSADDVVFSYRRALERTSNVTIYIDSVAGIEKVEATDVDMTAQLTRLKNAGADALILVANAAPGAQMMKARERMGWKVPVVSHWGISGGRFDELVGPTAGEAHFVQTYSFAGALNDTGKRVYTAMQAKYGVKTPADVLAPVGTANAYDAMNLLARAIEKAKGTDGEAIRKAMYEIDDYAGLIKTYKKPFGPNDHEGLAPDDYIMVKFEGSKIVPVK